MWLTSTPRCSRSARIIWPSGSLPRRAIRPVRRPSLAAAEMTLASTPPGPERRSRMKTPSSRRGSTETRWVWSTTALPTATRSSRGAIAASETVFGGHAARFLHEATNQIEVLPTATVAVGAGKGVDAGRPDVPNGIGQIVWVESAGQYHRDCTTHPFDNAGTHVPVMYDTGSTDARHIGRGRVEQE